MMYSHDENRIPRNGTEIIDVTKEEGEEGSAVFFCGVCLKNLHEVNFLLRIKHVKECCRLYGKVSEKMLSGSGALKLFLEYHGCLEYYDRFVVKDLAHVHGMDSHELRRLQNVVGGRKKLELALEHYALHGRLPLRASLLARGASEKSQKKVKKNTYSSLMGRQQQQQRNESASNETVHASSRRTSHRHDTEDSRSRLRRIERMLFLSLYEDTDEDDFKQRGSGSCGRLLNHQSVVYQNNSHVGQDESMWVGAACCGFELRGGSLEKRIALKRGISRDDNRGVGHHIRQESLAVKKVRLKAMEDELRVQLSTVKELEGMIASLKHEIDGIDNTTT